MAKKKFEMGGGYSPIARVFERDAESGTFLEFREGRADGPSPGAEEAELEARLATLVTYAPGHADQWLEVPLPTPSGG